MTLTKSLLLGSAAGLVAVASAQAADLPTRKGPVAVEYVRVCSITVAGAPVVGFVLPGSDTCFKISGYITGQVEGGNLKQAYGFSVDRGGNSKGGDYLYQTITPYGGEARDAFGMSMRYNLTVDAVSNTAYGPLVAHGEYQFNYGSGFDNVNAGSDGGINRAYVTWAGITAGKIDSFFSFTGGGLAWANFFSPDRKGFNQPDVLAYTASFGGGFSATISIENNEPGWSGVNNCGSASSASFGNNNGYTNCAAFYTSGSNMGFLGSATQDGERVPDVVGSIDVKQAWGTAHLAGVLHEVRGSGSYYSGYYDDESYSSYNASIDKFGYAIDAGVSFNIPQLAGSVIGITGSYAQNATWYSGIPDAMWGENGQVNGNGIPMAIGDAYLNSDGSWATPTSWSVTGWAAFQVSPQVNLGVEGSYGEVNWGNTGAGTSPLYNSRSWLVGGIAHYDPVKNLDFEFELLYQSTENSQPTAYQPGSSYYGSGYTNSWQGNADGFAARFEVTRSF
jgi:hypothetical protein